MIVYACRLELAVPGSQTLKDKRRVVQSVIRRLRNRYNVAVAEVDALHNHSRALIGIVCVSNSAEYAHGLMEKAVSFVEDSRLDCQVVDYSIELLT